MGYCAFMDRSEEMFPPDEPVVRTGTPHEGTGAEVLLTHDTIDLHKTVELRELGEREGSRQLPGADDDLIRVAVVGSGGRLAGRMLADAYAQRGETRYLISDAGTDTASPIWQTAVAEADRIVVAVDAAGPASTAALATLDEIGAAGRADMLRAAITVVLLPPARRGLNRGHEDVTALRGAFGSRTADVIFAPYTAHASAAVTAAWEHIAAALDRLG